MCTVSSAQRTGVFLRWGTSPGAQIKTDARRANASPHLPTISRGFPMLNLNEQFSLMHTISAGASCLKQMLHRNISLKKHPMRLLLLVECARGIAWPMAHREHACCRSKYPKMLCVTNVQHRVVPNLLVFCLHLRRQMWWETCTKLHSLGMTDCGVFRHGQGSGQHRAIMQP